MLRRSAKQNTYFKKVLIANRGEIACRIIKTCKRLGIGTVAVHSTADEMSKFVKMADEAVCIGPPPSKESYLCIDKVLAAVKKTGADAVHPGYGFLSENHEFSRALKQNGVTFIGPDEHSINSMGDKINSKKLATAAKVNTIPGFLGEITSDEHCMEVCHSIGYPVMIKASAGGGGKGIRVANNDQEAVEFLKLCKEEAAASFGDDRMLVEKFVSNPRHIEIQVIADRRGNTLYLPERECSIQRRNQKVIEEAPSSFIDPATRKKMGEQAAAMARAVQYVTAGTVEMMVDENKNFYFLEMNTRLQVEHPITEAITGLDIVEEMLRAAAGLELSVKQPDIKINGWATECRVYAEDPLQNYFPQIGRLSAYREPHHIEGVRVDSGILEGSQISVYYDPMISKLITWGKDRNESLERMGRALDSYIVRGLKHNICLLRAVITHPRYVSGNFTTLFLAEEYKGGFQGHVLSADEQRLLSIASAIMRCKREILHGSTADSFTYDTQITGPAKQGVVGNVSLTLKASKCGSEYAVDGKTFSVCWEVGSPVMAISVDGTTTYFQYIKSDKLTYTVQYYGSPYDVRILTPEQQSLVDFMPKPQHAAHGNSIMAPMPGAVISVHAAVGDKVSAGQDIITLEAMKMRNKLKSPVKGTIKSIKVKPGQTVDDGELLVQIEEQLEEDKKAKGGIV
eukprot:PhF_6_TR1021/c0_g1_i1/m.2050/K01965/PCCA, pccA; propionyl-CoA carboxylase alpha chain